jgi:hypothetical protein
LLGEALYFAQLELHLIAVGQETADHYSRRDLARLRRWIADNRASLAAFQQGKA